MPDAAKRNVNPEPEAPSRKAQRRGRSARHLQQAAEPAPSERPVWPGVEGGRYRPLTERQVERVHRTALDLLERVGLASADLDEARQMIG